MPSPSFDPTHRDHSHALDELRAEIEAIPTSELEPIRLDITSAIVTALGVAPNVARFRDTIERELGAAAARPIDQLETSAVALGRANAIYLTSLHASSLDEIVAEVSHVRRVLMLEAEGLVAKKRLRASSLAEIVGGVGYKAMCFDVVQLVSVFRADWAAIEAHTPVTGLELDQAEARALALATTLGEIEQSGASSPAAELRQRAYTHFVHTYEEVRRAMAYLFFDDDGDDIAPSLFAGRTRRRADDEDDSDPTDTPLVPIVPIAPIVPAPSNGPVAPVVPFDPDLPGPPPFVTS